MSSKGEQYLRSARPDHQPPLLLQISSELFGDEGHQKSSSGIRDLKGLSALEQDGFSEVGNFHFRFPGILAFVFFKFP